MPQFLLCKVRIVIAQDCSEILKNIELPIPLE